MKVAVFSSHSYDRVSLAAANTGHQFTFLEAPLTENTARLAAGFPAVCLFVNDRANAPVLETLAAGGTRLLALRSAGFNHVDLAAAERLGMTVLRVPAYSPHAVAEHTVAMILCLNRKIHRAYNRVREQNFNLEGLMGFDLAGKTVGLIGTGKIGEIVARIMFGFSCRVIAFDPAESPACRALGVRYAALDEVLRDSDIISLHCPLTPKTHHLLNDTAFANMKPGAMLVNTSRGGVIDTPAAIDALKTGHLGALAIDVYEEEGDLFFRDLSEQVLTDDVFARLMTFPNVLVTAHQAFFTREAVASIAQTTVRNITDFESGAVRPENHGTAAQFAR